MTKSLILPPLNEDFPYQRFCLTTEGRMMPLIPPKAVQVFNCNSRVVLLCGARKSSKTLSGLCNRVMRHLWEVDGAIVGVVGKSVKNVGGGLWHDLTRFCLPGWVHANFGMTITQGEKMTSDSHMRYMRVSNAHGTQSEIQLHSLPNDHHVEEKFKSLRFSMLALSEVDQFRDRLVMDIMLDQLRLTGVPYEQHQLIADCNPPDEGKDHWLWNALANRDEGNTGLMPESACFHFDLDDNPFLHPEELKNLKAKYLYDPVKYARFVEGRWVKDTTKGHFDLHFTYNIHVIGDTNSPDKNQWELIVPPESCTEIIIGMDPGDLNHAATFMVARSSDSHDIVFDLFDEVVFLDTPTSLKEFTIAITDRMEFWEKLLGHKVHWRFWCDASALNYKANSDRSDAMVIYAESNCRIVPRAATKGSGSVRQRIDLIKRLLHENRLFVSAKCVETIAWLQHLAPGRKATELIATGSRFKHGFDSTSYALVNELPIEISRRHFPETSKIDGLVHV